MVKTDTGNGTLRNIGDEMVRKIYLFIYLFIYLGGGGCKTYFLAVFSSDNKTIANPNIIQNLQSLRCPISCQKLWLTRRFRDFVGIQFKAPSKFF